MPNIETGLRERKKRETRARMIDAAIDLVEKQGYANTTVDQIAEAVDVSPRTVAHYFPSKDQLLLSVVVPGAVRTPLVHSVEIAGVDRDHPRVARWVDRFSGHAVTPDRVAGAILTGVVRNRFLIYTSPDIRALYAFKRLAWWPYSVAMRRANVIFTRVLRPAARPSGRDFPDQIGELVEPLP